MRAGFAIPPRSYKASIVYLPNKEKSGDLIAQVSCAGSPLTDETRVAGAVESELALQFHPGLDFADERGLADGRRADARGGGARLDWLVPVTN